MGELTIVHKKLADDRTKQVEQLDEQVKEKDIIVSALTTEKSNTENQNTELLQRLDRLENEKKLESKFFDAKEQWAKDKDFHLLKEWDKLPKRKWYLLSFLTVTAVIVAIMCILYNQYHSQDIIKLLMSLSTIIGGTIILSFFNRDKITTSFMYNFRTENFRKQKIKELEVEYLKKHPEPKRIDYTEYK